MYTDTDIPQIGCVIMASGISRRFGENKLLADFQGQTLIERVLKLTDGELFARRIVVTRTEEVAQICQNSDIEVILHDCSGRGDAVRIGMEQMTDRKDRLDGCIFIPCDQPLLQRKSLVRMMEKFSECSCGMIRLGYEEKCGAPVLFSKEYFQELMELPSEKGGSFIIKKYPEQVKIVQADCEYELSDMDTSEDYRRLLELYKLFNKQL